MKKHNFLFLSTLIFTLFTVSSCIDDDGNFFSDCEKGQGPVVEQVLSLPDFTGVEVKTSVDVFISQGDEVSVLAKGEQNIIDLLETDVRNNVWEIEFDDCVSNFKLEIFITMPEIDYLKISGSGEITGETFFDVDDLTLRITGSGEMCLGLTAENIDAKITGSGDMEMEGEAGELDLKITGSGDVNAFPLNVQRADIEITGSGDASLTVLEQLKVKITGSGDVLYKGNPALDIDINGSGDVVDAN